jgi:hypothetical protein
MIEPFLLVPVSGAVASLGCLWASLRLRKRQRLLSDLPTSQVRGVFIGLVELKGMAESETPFTSYLAETACVHYGWHVEERWSRTVTETTTDSQGRSQTRTRTESGWKTVAQGGESAPFYLRDETGALLIRPEGARIEPLDLFSQTVSRNDPLYYGKGPEGAVGNSDHVRRFVETGLPLHAMLFVVGPARERTDIVAPEIAAQAEAPLFLISTRSEQKVQSSLAVWTWFWWAAGFLICALPLILIVADRDESLPPDLLRFAGLPVAVYLLLWGLGWVWMVYNSLVGLRERVRQGWSLVEVQLKRRHDLIPSLAAAVAGLGAHEREVQETAAALRAQLTATAPGVAGPDFEGMAARLRGVIEKYPQLTAQAGFGALHAQLVETEQRIALARAYYNDIAAHFMTRLQIVPDAWVARLGAMRPEPLLTATSFERAATPVSFSA